MIYVNISSKYMTEEQYIEYLKREYPRMVNFKRKVSPKAEIESLEEYVEYMLIRMYPEKYFLA